MNKSSIKFLCALIPFKKLRRSFRNFLCFREVSKLNKIQIDPRDKKRIRLKIVGQNNEIVIKKLKGKRGILRFSLVGDGCQFLIDDGVEIVGSLVVNVGQNTEHFCKVKNTSVHISRGCYIEDASIITWNSNTKIEVGEKCMFSSGVLLYQTDGHPVYDLESGKMTNKLHQMTIGNHVWLGYRTTVLKNVSIADDCIIGLSSVVTKSFSEPHCAIGGNPARVIKTNITWRQTASDGYVQNELEEGI